MLETLLALMSLAGTLGLSAATVRLQGELRAARDALFRREIAQAEAERLLRAEQRLAQAQQISESAVALGTGVVRGVHRGIAAIPFGILEAIPATRDTTRIVRRTHDLISEAVYGSIGAVNRGVGATLREGLQSGSGQISLPQDGPRESLEGPSR